MGTTVIYVTHDQIEALTMSTKVAIFFEGVLVQVAPPMDVYKNPVNLKVADFIGNPRINFVDAKGKLNGDTLVVTSDLGTFTYDKKHFTANEFPQNGEFDCVLGLRPEQLLLTAKESEVIFDGTVYASQPAGSETLVQIQVKNTRLLVKELGIANYQLDQKVQVGISPALVNVYNKESGYLIKYAV
jgi:multiple sugar transport system ATP-binding protein